MGSRQHLNFAADGANVLQAAAIDAPFFMHNLLRFAPAVRGSGEFVGALADGKVAMIDVQDIAAVAATALTSSGHAGRAYHITGPEALSYQEVAERLARILDKPVIYRNITLEAMRGRLLASGMPDWQVNVQMDFSTALSAGHASTVTDAVEAVTGQPPRSVEQFIRKHVAQFTD